MNKKRYQNLFSSLGRRIVLALSLLLALGLFLAPNIQAQIKQSKAPSSVRSSAAPSGCLPLNKWWLLSKS